MNRLLQVVGVMALGVALFVGCGGSDSSTSQAPSDSSSKADEKMPEKASDASKASAPAKTAKKSTDPAKQGPDGGGARKEPDYITVQHCLIGFQGSVSGKSITRSKADAKKLAEALFAKAKAGADFDAMVTEYTNDSPPGIYKMSNIGAKSRPGVYARTKMVRAFGDTGFPLEVGEYGLAPHDPEKSMYGWHIVKRIE